MKHFITVLAFCLASSVCAAPQTTVIEHNKGKKLTIACGKTQATIQCDPSSKDCTRTTLQMKLADGATKNLEKPKGMADYTAIGMVCHQTNDGTPYLVVEYGELPFGCSFCEWYHLYTTKGEVLTHSDPPILEDKELPNGKTRYSNNEQYEALSKKLGLKHLSTLDFRY